MDWLLPQIDGEVVGDHYVVTDESDDINKGNEKELHHSALRLTNMGGDEIMMILSPDENKNVVIDPLPDDVTMGPSFEGKLCTIMVEEDLSGNFDANVLVDDIESHQVINKNVKKRKKRYNKLTAKKARRKKPIVKTFYEETSEDPAENVDMMNETSSFSSMNLIGKLKIGVKGQERKPASSFNIQTKFFVLSEEMKQPGYLPMAFRGYSPAKLKNVREMPVTEEDIINCSEQSMLVPVIKGIAQLKNFRARIQVSCLGTSLGRYTTTCDSVVEACYRYESILLLSNQPTNIRDLMEMGNYHSLCLLTTISCRVDSVDKMIAISDDENTQPKIPVHSNLNTESTPEGSLSFYFFRNPWQYYIALGCWIVHFYKKAQDILDGILSIDVQDDNQLLPNNYMARVSAAEKDVIFHKRLVESFDNLRCSFSEDDLQYIFKSNEDGSLDDCKQIGSSSSSSGLISDCRVDLKSWFSSVLMPASSVADALIKNEASRRRFPFPVFLTISAFEALLHCFMGAQSLTEINKSCLEIFDQLPPAQHNPSLGILKQKVFPILASSTSVESVEHKDAFTVPTKKANQE